MGFEIFINILRWVTELIGKICDLPPAHPSSYFMTSPYTLKTFRVNARRGYTFCIPSQCVVPRAPSLAVNEIV